MWPHCLGVGIITVFAAGGTEVLGKGQKLGVVVLGGLGHIGVKFAHGGFGLNVGCHHFPPNKAADRNAGLHESGEFFAHSEEMRSTPGSFDFILDTVSAKSRSVTLTASC